MEKGSNYILNADLLKEIVVYKETGIASELLGKMLLDIANHFSTKGNFSGYTWRKDMVGDAVLTCLKYIRSFNPEKSSNAFAYVTQIIKNSFVAHIKLQKRHLEIRDVCVEKYVDLMEDGKYYNNINSIDYRVLAAPKKKRKKKDDTGSTL